MQTILGANGTIARVLARELKTYTNAIRLVSRNPKGVNDTDELFAADLTDSSIVDKAIAGSEIVYLLVGFEYSTKVWQQQWPALMRAVLDACIRHKAKLVFFDNVYMYKPSTIPHMTEQSPIGPTSKKGLVRQQIADMLLIEVKGGKLDALIARSADFYGPDNDKSFLIETVYKNIKKGKKPMWFINADKKHSFTYTPDAAKATALLGNTSDAFNQVWHLPTDERPFTGREMVSLFAKEMNVSNKVFVLPGWLLRLMGLFSPFMRELIEMLYQYDQDYYFDSSKFKKRFDFETTSYEKGVKNIVVKSV